MIEGYKKVKRERVETKANHVVLSFVPFFFTLWAFNWIFPEIRLLVLLCVAFFQMTSGGRCPRQPLFIFRHGACFMIGHRRSQGRNFLPTWTIVNGIEIKEITIKVKTSQPFAFHSSRYLGRGWSFIHHLYSFFLRPPYFQLFITKKKELGWKITLQFSMNLPTF